MTQSDSMILGNCTFCRGIVRIPVTVDPRASVRCPHCGETAELKDVLEAAVPELEIVAPRSQPAPVESIEVQTGETRRVEKREDGKFEVSPVLREGAKRKKRSDPDRQRSSRETRPAPSGPSVKLGSPQSRDGASRSASSRGRRSSSTSSRSNSFHRSPVWEAAKIGLGGLLALPVAQLMVWWFVGVDPLGLARPVSQVLPMIVPDVLLEPPPKAVREPEDSPLNPPMESSDPLDETL